MQRLSNAVITSVNEFMVVYSEKGRNEWMENRKCYGLSFCKSGRIVYEKDGVRTVSDPGTAVLLPQGQTYYIHRTESGTFPVINFTCAEPFSIPEVVAIPLESPAIYLREFEIMQSLSIFRYNRLRMLGIFYGMLHRLVQETTEREGVLKPALDYLEQHYTDWDLSGEVLAEHAGISEVYMRQLFREQMGISPKRYILELRIERAKQLLWESRMAVQDIAAACGFGTANHFCRKFREMTGQTPGEYRRLSRKGM